MRSTDKIRKAIPVMLILFFVIGFFCLIVYRGSNYKEPEEKTIESTNQIGTTTFSSVMISLRS